MANQTGSLLVGYLTKPPFTLNNQKLEELFYQIFLLIMTRLNTTFTLIKPQHGLWGVMDNHTMTWDGLIGDLVNNKVDVVMNSLAQTEEREGVVDFSIPIYIYRPVFARWYRL